MTDDLLQTLRAAVDRLYYPSESDAPFEVFRWPRAAGRTPRSAVAGHEDDGVRLEEQSPDAFFAPLADVQDAERFRSLRRAMEAAARGLTIVRAGERRVAIYLIGRARDGQWVGVRTTSVET